MNDITFLVVQGTLKRLKKILAEFSPRLPFIRNFDFGNVFAKKIVNLKLEFLVDLIVLHSIINVLLTVLMYFILY